MTAVATGGVVLGTAAAVSAVDSPGRVILAVAALGLLVIAGSAAIRRPRLVVRHAVLGDPRLGIRRLRETEWFGRCDIVRGRSSRVPRFGRRTGLLELDVVSEGQERLFVFGRWDLGAAPDEVYHVLVEHGLVGEDN